MTKSRLLLFFSFSQSGGIVGGNTIVQAVQSPAASTSYTMFKTYRKEALSVIKCRRHAFKIRGTWLIYKSYIGTEY